jgi:hypothetical protein
MSNDLEDIKKTKVVKLITYISPFVENEKKKK